MNGYWMFAIASLWLLLVVIAIAQLGLLRRVAPLLEGHPHRLERLQVGGLPAGARPDNFRLVDADGRDLDWHGLLGRPMVVLLSDPGCAPCDRLAAELREHQPHDLAADLVVISRQLAGELRLPPWVTTLRQIDDGAATAFDTVATPHAFAVDSDGVVRGNTIPASVDDLAALATRLDKIRA